MPFRLKIINTAKDTRASVRLKQLQNIGLSSVKEVKIIDVYTIDKDFSEDEKNKIGAMLINPVFESYTLEKIEGGDVDYAIEVGFLPGVTDNTARTAKEAIEDLLKVKFDTPKENVYSSQITLVKGISETDAAQVGEYLANPLIQRISIKSQEEFNTQGDMDLVIPKVNLTESPQADEVNIDLSDEELMKLSKQGVPNADGTGRGPLALRLSYLHAIKDYFLNKEKRNPTDIEIESIAQTWSEHCKHTIFADPIDEVKDGLYKHYIKRATNEIRKARGDDDFCVSVFSDNSGAIIFDENYLVTDKAETHNSPAALDPFGAAITGIVGVNRDTLGFGRAAKPIINRYGYCFGNPQEKEPLYRGKDQTNPALTSRQVMDGVIKGVNAGGNESGIPSPQGFAYFEDRYRGKPLVFVGTIGLVPKEINGKPSWEKAAQPGDQIVVIGGRVGMDGIHGATFSSEALDSGSPATAVQIGDPITQKKLSDAIVREARDMDLYNSITDNGAGGISCSVAEMARECGGCLVNLDQVPLKYPNLSPWQIWISESQERMTLAIPKEKLDAFKKLMDKRAVEMTVIGEFNDSGRCTVVYEGKKIMDIEMNFLHDGLPEEEQKTTYTRPTLENPKFECPEDLNDTMLKMISRNNLASKEFISMQYDHEVQAGSVIKPLIGKGRVNGTASVTAPVLGSKKGVVASQGINPRYSDLDTYHMGTAAIDTAIRNAVAVGANPDYLAIMDNFCWCSSDEPERLGQLKETARACYESAVAMGTPFISGKDSMFNDFKGYDEESNPIKISIPPTLLASSMGVIDNIETAISFEPKFADDLVYVIGETKAELGGSEYFHMHNEIGADVPETDTQVALDRYRRFYQATQKQLMASAFSVELGGLAAALMKMVIASELGLEVDLNELEHSTNRNDYALFSESQSRFVVTINPKNQADFEALIPEAKLVGKVTKEPQLKVNGFDGKGIVNLSVKELGEAYRRTFRNY